LSGRGLCDELITRPEESYRLWCVAVCDLETSRIGAPYIYDSSLRVNAAATITTATSIATNINAATIMLPLILLLVIIIIVFHKCLACVVLTLGYVSPSGIMVCNVRLQIEIQHSLLRFLALTHAKT